MPTLHRATAVGSRLISQCPISREAEPKHPFQRPVECLADRRECAEGRSTTAGEQTQSVPSLTRDWSQNGQRVRSCGPPAYRRIRQPAWYLGPRAPSPAPASLSFAVAGDGLPPCLNVARGIRPRAWRSSFTRASLSFAVAGDGLPPCLNVAREIRPRAWRSSFLERWTLALGHDLVDALERSDVPSLRICKRARIRLHQREDPVMPPVAVLACCKSQSGQDCPLLIRL